MWMKIKQTNNWEHLEYWLGEGKTKRVNSGEAIQVKFPDGHTDTFVVQSEPRTTSVSDHGHVYPVYTERLFVSCSLHGVETRVYLNTPGLEFMQEFYFVTNKTGRVWKTFDKLEEAKDYISKRKNPSDYGIGGF
jgi:hypothetical protein